MASRKLELECPGCKTHLEMDVGFAGGVCRCSTCGMLMTVPADPQGERPRPARPAKPGVPVAEIDRAAKPSPGVQPSATRQTPSPAADRERQASRGPWLLIALLLTMLLLAACSALVIYLLMART